MSGSLRDALEKLLVEWSELSTGYEPYRELRAVLAAHPAEPVGVSDEAVEAVAGHFYTMQSGIAWSQIDPHSSVALNYRRWATEALEAATPLMGATPVASRLAIWDIIATVRDASPRLWNDADTDDIVSALLAAGVFREPPTREQIGEALLMARQEQQPGIRARWGDLSEDQQDLFLAEADAVLALMGGAEK